MTGVVLRNLTRRFGEATAVNDLNLDVKSGQLVALLGPSGCGKTTTLRMIAGLLSPTGGDILFDGRSVLATPSEKRGAVMVFQKQLLFPTMNVAQNIGFGLKMRRVDRREIAARVKEMLALVRLPGFENRRANELSGGQQQRIALARALIIRPQVLLLDEPLANLDANLRLEMRELIRGIQRELNITTIFVTHDQEEAVMLADRVALMFDGVLQQFDPPRAFYERPRTAAVGRFFRNENFLPGVKQGNVVETNLGSLRVAPCPRPDGPVLLTIRPEDIRLETAIPDNTIEAKVLTSVYMGAHTQLQVDVGGRTWRVRALADCDVQPGETALLHLPAGRIWLLPQEEP